MAVVGTNEMAVVGTREITVTVQVVVVVGPGIVTFLPGSVIVLVLVWAKSACLTNFA
jgi:hypothetical protein